MNHLIRVLGSCILKEEVRSPLPVRVRRLDRLEPILEINRNYMKWHEIWNDCSFSQVLRVWYTWFHCVHYKTMWLLLSTTKCIHRQTAFTSKYFKLERTWMSLANVDSTYSNHVLCHFMKQSLKNQLDTQADSSRLRHMSSCDLVQFHAHTDIWGHAWVGFASSAASVNKANRKRLSAYLKACQLSARVQMVQSDLTSNNVYSSQSKQSLSPIQVPS